MKHKIVICSEEHRNRAVEIVKSLPLDPKHEVVIREYKRDRSAEQNSLYWQWLTVIGNELGNGKDEMHEIYKEKFLTTIYERDDPEYSATMNALRDVWRSGMKAEAAGLRKKIVHLTSTTNATVKQMSEYMTEIERHANSLAIQLPHPED